MLVPNIEERVDPESIPPSGPPTSFAPPLYSKKVNLTREPIFFICWEEC